jgi:hypothetical protein
LKDSLEVLDPERPIREEKRTSSYHRGMSVWGEDGVIGRPQVVDI